MIIGFAKRGTGRGNSPTRYLTDEMVSAPALDYLTGKKTRKGIVRNPAPVVVRGDPNRTRKLIDSLRFKNRYTSGVLSFSPGETITSPMEDKIIDDFERAAFAGLDRDRFEILWVRHRHTPTHRHELHFLSPRVDLGTGKSLNIAPPRKGTRELFDTQRSKINAEYGLEDPDDPVRRRDRMPSHEQKLRARNRVTSWKAKPTPNLQEVRNGPNPEKVAQLQRKLSVLIEARAAYNHRRYRVPADKPGIVLDTPTPTIQPNDRVRTTPSGCPEAARIALRGTRSAVRENVERFNEAARRWSRADGNIEFANQRFNRANRTFASGFEKTVTSVNQRKETSALFRKYGVPGNQRPISRVRDHDHDHDNEPELEIAFPVR